MREFREEREFGMREEIRIWNEKRKRKRKRKERGKELERKRAFFIDSLE